MDSNGDSIPDYTDILKYRSFVHEEILSLIYYSQGGFNWKELYLDIPIQMRRYYILKLQEILKKQNETGKEQPPPQVPKMPAKPSFKKPPAKK